MERRAFVIGAAALGALAACGGSGGGSSESSTTSTAANGGGIVGGLSAVRFFGPYFRAGVPARVPFALSDDDGLLSLALAPDQVSVSVRTPAAETIVSAETVVLRSEGLPRPYYAFSFTPDEPGFYDVTIDTGELGGEVFTQVQVVAADDEVASAMPGPGDPMPSVVTPTVADHRGVDPLCTREPSCEFHAASVDELVAAGKPFAFVVSTPAFCQTAICGPVLDVVIEEIAAFPGLTAVHAEVYREPAENQVPPVPEDFAPVVRELSLAFEPVLFTVGADGIIVDRVDYIFGSVEVRAALERLST